MHKITIQLSLYEGRQIDQTVFEKYFVQSGQKETHFVHDVVDDWNYVVYELHADVENNKVLRVEAYKHNNKDLSNAEWKHAFQIFDACFPDQSEKEVELVIADAVAKNVSYGGYSIRRAVKTYVEFLSPDGTLVRLSKSVISKAVGYSHHSLEVLLNPETTKEFIVCYGNTPYEPLFAVLSVIDPSKYPNYTELNIKYRSWELWSAVRHRDYEKCLFFADALLEPKENTVEIGRYLYYVEDPRIINWFFSNIPDGYCDLNLALRNAIEKDRKDIVAEIIRKKLYNPEQKFDSSASPMKAAFEHPEYLLPMLKCGFALISESKFYNDQFEEYYSTLTWDQVKDLLEYRVFIGQRTIDRALEAGRTDIVEIIEANPQKYN